MDRSTATGSSPPRGPRRADADHHGVAGNARLTAGLAAVLFVLLAAEGVTVLKVGTLLGAHVFIGMLLVPPVAVKIASTGYRFSRYYLGSPPYRRKGPPPPLLRLLGPVVVVSTVVLLASGVALLLVAPGQRAEMLLAHKASFVVWFGAMTLHVLGHLLETARLAPQDWLRRTRVEVRGARVRQWIIAASVAAGIPLGLALVGRVGTWLATSPPSH